jgi:hypothetical protein
VTRLTFAICDLLAAETNMRGYDEPKYVQFGRTMLGEGFEVWLHESLSTASKYLYVRFGGREFKVRFSNHKPRFGDQRIGDCDFYVGHSHGRITNTKQAINATIRALRTNQ